MSKEKIKYVLFTTCSPSFQGRVGEVTIWGTKQVPLAAIVPSVDSQSRWIHNAKYKPITKEQFESEAFQKWCLLNYGPNTNE